MRSVEFMEVRPLGFGEMKPMDFLVDKSNETYFFSNIIVVDDGYVASGAKYHFSWLCA